MADSGKGEAGSGAHSLLMEPEKMHAMIRGCQRTGLRMDLSGSAFLERWER